MKVPGSCLCGAVKYTLAVNDPQASAINVICHCLDCRKMSGSLFGANTLCDETVSGASHTPLAAVSG